MDMDTHSDSHDATEDPLEDVSNVEARFYKEGYDIGHAHGALHGTFEGREIGREKAFELWEEVGYYEGTAELWSEILSSRKEQLDLGAKETRALNHAQGLLRLIQSFPITNPSAGPPTTTQTSTTTSNGSEDHVTHGQGSEIPALGSHDAKNDIDLPALLSAIRARYRLLCSSLNVRPRLTARQVENGSVEVDEEAPIAQSGIDTTQLRF